jgi:hypothetical protein
MDDFILSLREMHKRIDDSEIVTVYPSAFSVYEAILRILIKLEKHLKLFG